MGQSSSINLQGQRPLLFMHSSAVMDHNRWPGHNIRLRQTADMPASQL